jgi:hypothetical protein
LLANHKLEEAKNPIYLLSLKPRDNKALLVDEKRVIRNDAGRSIIKNLHFKIGINIPSQLEIIETNFQGKLSKVFNKYARRISNLAITSISSLHFHESANRVAYEYISTDKFIYQESVFFSDFRFVGLLSRLTCLGKLSTSILTWKILTLVSSLATCSASRRFQLPSDR